MSCSFPGYRSATPLRLQFTLNSAGTVLAASSEVARLGYAVAKLLGQPIDPLFDRNDRPALRAQLCVVHSACAQLPDFYRLIDAAGQAIPVQLAVQPLQAIEGDLHLLLCESLTPATDMADYCQQLQRLNLELERQMHARTAELQLAFEFEATLKRITDKVRDSLDEDQILQTAVQELVLAIGVKCCNAALFDLDRGISIVRYEYATSIAPDLGRVSRIGNFPELYSQLLQGHSFQFCSLLPNPVRGRVAMLTCPVLDDQGVLGALWLVNHSFYAFNAQDIRLVRQVANQCAIAIRQARLFQAAQAQVQELERLNQLKDDFLSTVSHELRTPMTNIKLATQMLTNGLQQSGSLNSRSALRYLHILQTECQREIGLIDDLLLLAQFDSLEATLSQQPRLSLVAIDLHAWLLPLLQPFHDRAQAQRQHLKISLPADLPPLRTDADSLKRIVTELMKNACKYTPSGGSIWVAAEQAAAGLRLRITNSGAEIPKPELARIFDRFYRVPKADPWRYSGTGLGLALVKELVAGLGAAIEVESDAQQTRFTVSFPTTV